MKVWSDIWDYVPFRNTSSGVNTLKLILQAMVQECSPNVYQDRETMERVLKGKISDVQISQIILMTQVSGFERVIEIDSSAKKEELNRYARCAMQETGLNRAVIMQMIEAIAYSLDVNVVCNTQDEWMNAESAQNIYIIPNCMYEKDLEYFRKRIQNGKEIQASDVEKLAPLVEAGLPKAKFYMGYLLLMGTELPEDSEKGLKLLHEAEAAGDVEAAGVLGDYYFAHKGQDGWSKAYRYYTGLGGMALNNTRKNAVISIFNHKKYNQKILFTSILLALAIIIGIIFMPVMTLYTVHPVWKVLCVLMEVGAVVGMILWNRNYPYDSIENMPAILFGIGCLFWLIRLLF